MPRKPGITDELIIQMYKSDIPYKEMMTITGLSDRAIYNVIKKHNIQIKKEQYAGQPRKHRVNENFFKVWTHEMAWVLGLFITDGTVNGKIHSINFAQKDERLLKIVANYMDVDYVISQIGKTRTVPILVINSKEIRKDLANLGIASNKSLTVPFPHVPEEFLGAFIRGVVDGDGYVSPNGYTMNVTTASIDFAQGLLEVFKSMSLNSYIRTVYNSDVNKIYRVCVSGKNDLMKLSEYLYKHVDDENFHFYKRVYFSQHSQKPFIIEDDRQEKAWEIINGKIVHINNSKKQTIKCRIDHEILSKIKIIAKENQVFINELIEPEIINLLNKTSNFVMKTKNERVEFRTTFNVGLINQMKQKAELNRVSLSGEHFTKSSTM